MMMLVSSNVMTELGAIIIASPDPSTIKMHVASYTTAYAQYSYSYKHTVYRA